MRERRDAHFSDCGGYRFRLDRVWDVERPQSAFIGLNPSIGDAENDDATLRKVRGFSERFGYGGFFMLNLFAFVATDPRELKAAAWPAGGDMADRVIERTLDIVEATGGDAICCWGSNAKGLARPAEIVRMIRTADLSPRALAINGDGTPAHPLMLPYGEARAPIPWKVRL